MNSAAATRPVHAVEADPARRDAAMRAMVRSLAADVGAPVAVYYVAHVLGASDYVALLAGAVRNHLSSAIGKTNATGGADAARIADNNGWL